jgi:hypothetical protein
MEINYQSIIRSLMLCENLGDVHDVINGLCGQAGIERFEGDFVDGWTDEDMQAAGFDV